MAEQNKLLPGNYVGSAEERFHRDKQCLIARCGCCDFVKVVSSADDSVVLEYTSGEKRSEYTILFTPDYPASTIVTCSTDPSDVKCYNQPVVVIFSELCREWCSAHELKLPQEIEMVSPRPTPPPPAERLESQISYASSDMTDDGSDDNDYNDYYDDDTYENQDVLNSLLEQDIDRVQNLHGKNSVEYRVHAGINEVDILLYIDMSFLDIHTSSAWGVNAEDPVVVQLHLQSASKYLDGPEPKIEVFQTSLTTKERRKFGLGLQIQKIVQVFLSNRWKTISNYYLEHHMDRVVPPRSLPPPIPSPTPSPSVITPTNTPPAQLKIIPKFIQRLLEMGFPTNSAEQAVEVCGEDLDKAVHLLTTGELVDKSTGTKTGDAPPTTDGSKEKGETPTAPQPPPLPPSLLRQDSQGAKANLSHVEDSLDNVKHVPSLDEGFLAQIVQYTLNRVPSLNEFCVICDERHVLETGLIKPCVCTRELCVFAFQTLGVMADAAESVATDASVVDLLIAMCNAAAISSRAQLILDPYPSIVDPGNTQRLAMDPSKKDFDQIKKVMKAIITGREELLRGRCTYGSLKEVLDIHNRLAFPLMQWIVATNRAYIVMVPEDRQLKTMNTKYQFLLISSPPAKEAAFQRARTKDGSTFAFHGSSIENWHSIMRKGLINASGTKFQMHGAAYGSGIYLSPRSGTSFGYTNRYHSTTGKDEGDTLAGKLGLTCIALCEVVTSKDLKKSGDIWVCPNSEHVVTRFFFVYDDKNAGYCDCNTQEKAFRQEVLHTVQLAQQLKKK